MTDNYNDSDNKISDSLKSDDTYSDNTHSNNTDSDGSNSEKLDSGEKNSKEQNFAQTREKEKQPKLVEKPDEKTVINKSESGDTKRRESIRDALVGTTIDDRYHLLELVGKGGSSSVYKTQDKDSDRIVALKLLHSHLRDDPLMVERFEREAKAGKDIAHPNVIDVEKWVMNENGQIYMIMEFVDGISLQDAITHGLTPAQVHAIAMQTCAALSTAHDMGIVHRDLKPGNIMLLLSKHKKLKVKVLDFGIAKILPMNGDTVLRHTQSSNMLGSFLYMSPEQCLDLDIDGRSDLYSLACLLYEALTGRPPLIARTVFETMNKQLTEMPASLKSACPALSVSKEFESVLFKALAKKPEERYESIEDFQSALADLEESSSDGARLEEWHELFVLKEKQNTGSNSDAKGSGITSKEIVRRPDNEIVQSPTKEEDANSHSVTTTISPDEIRSKLRREYTKSSGALTISLILLAGFSLNMIFGFFIGDAIRGAINLIASLFSIVFICAVLLDQKDFALLKEAGHISYFKFPKLKQERIQVCSIQWNNSNKHKIEIKTSDKDSPKVEEYLISTLSIEYHDALLKLQQHKKRSSLSSKKLPEPLEFPLPGYLFRNQDGKPVAVSIQRDTAWIVYE